MKEQNDPFDFFDNMRLSFCPPSLTEAPLRFFGKTAFCEHIGRSYRYGFFGTLSHFRSDFRMVKNIRFHI